ncbi:MAG: T9SS type A sorting domain-containing protein [Saprospiraceae bacterium]
MMKNILSIVIVLIIAPIIGYSQYHPMLKQGSAWHHYFWQEASCNHHLIVSGDTTINNHQYKKIVNLGDLCNYEYYTFAREDNLNKQVFYYYYDTTEVMIYDYSLKKGDTIKSAFQYYAFEMVVDSISSLLPQYSPCFLSPEVYIETPKIFYLSHINCPSCKQTIWIEGIGNISNPFYSFTSWTAGNLGDALLCHFDETGFRDYHYIFCEESESCKGPIVKTEDSKNEAQIEFYPNPFFDNIYLKIDNLNTIKSIYYYNSQGLLIKSEKEIISDNFCFPNFNSGLIFAVVFTKDGNFYTRKLIKR